MERCDDIDMALWEAVAKAIFKAEHPNAEWNAGRARAIWWTRAAAAIDAYRATQPKETTHD